MEVASLNLEQPRNYPKLGSLRLFSASRPIHSRHLLTRTYLTIPDYQFVPCSDVIQDTSNLVEERWFVFRQGREQL